MRQAILILLESKHLGVEFTREGSILKDMGGSLIKYIRGLGLMG